jgi:hypothetical protein
MLMKCAVFWDIMRHYVVIVYRRFPETSVNNYHTMPRNIPEDRIFHVSVLLIVFRVNSFCVSVAIFAWIVLYTSVTNSIHMYNMSIVWICHTIDILYIWRCSRTLLEHLYTSIVGAVRLSLSTILNIAGRTRDQVSRVSWRSVKEWTRRMVLC